MLDVINYQKEEILKLDDEILNLQNENKSINKDLSECIEAKKILSIS